MGVNIESSIDNLSCQDMTFFSTLQWNYFLIENTKDMAFHNWHKWTCIAICMYFFLFQRKHMQNILNAKIKLEVELN